MHEIKKISQANDEIDIRELLSAIWAGKWLVMFVTTIFTVASVFYALQLPDIYKSEVTLAPAEDGGLKVPGQLGGLAALAGVSLGGMGSTDKTSLALEILKSRDFLGRFIDENDLYLPLMASKGWNRSENQLILDETVYDQQKEEWVRNVSEPYLPKPSRTETLEEFKKIFSINQEKTTGIVKLSIEHYSPHLAKIWTEKLVKAINEEMRTRELKEAERSIDYLNTKILETNLADVRTMLFSLIEEQIKTVMLASVRDEYVFKTIDPASISEEKHKPSRVLIILISFIGGLFFSMIMIVSRYLMVS